MPQDDEGTSAAPGTLRSFRFTGGRFTGPPVSGVLGDYSGVMGEMPVDTAVAPGGFELRLDPAVAMRAGETLRVSVTADLCADSLATVEDLVLQRGWSYEVDYTGTWEDVYTAGALGPVRRVVTAEPLVHVTPPPDARPEDVEQFRRVVAEHERDRLEPQRRWEAQRTEGYEAAVARIRVEREVREAAEVRATELLMLLLRPDQQHEYRAYQYVTERGSRGGLYRLTRNRTGGVTLVGDCRDCPTATFCISIAPGLPDADNIAAQVLALRTDEAGFLTTANLVSGRYPDWFTAERPAGNGYRRRPGYEPSPVGSDRGARHDAGQPFYRYDEGNETYRYCYSAVTIGGTWLSAMT